MEKTFADSHIWILYVQRRVRYIFSLYIYYRKWLKFNGMSDVNVGVGGLKKKKDKKKVEQKGSINMVAKERPLLLHPQSQSQHSAALGEKRTFDLTFHIEHGGRTDELKYIEKKKENFFLSFFSLLTIATLSPTLL